MHRAALVTHVVILHQQAQGAAAAHQPVAAAESGEMGIGMLQQLLQVVGLGDAPEDLAVGGADQLADLAPAVKFGPGGLQLGLAGLAALALAVVIAQGEGGLVAGPLGLVQPWRQVGLGLLQGLPAASQLVGHGVTE